MSTKIQFRRGTTAQWAAANPILASGELGLDTTTGQWKIGDGAATWTALSAWTAVTFTNAWVDFGAPANVVQYRKLGDIVYLRGGMKTGTINTAAFTFPAGFRPPATLGFPTVSNGLFGWMAVDSAGVFTPIVGSNVLFYVNCQFSTI